MQATEFQNEQEAITVAELAQMLGMSRDSALRRVRELVATGKARVTKKRIPDTSGRMQIKPAYVLTA